MPIEFYRILHVAGLATLLFGFGVLVTLALTGQMKNKKAKITGFVTHGLGLLIMVVSGFGMAAKLHLMSEIPNWLFAKIGVWLLLGLTVSVIKRKPQMTGLHLALILGLVTTAAFLGIMKPF